MGRSLTRLGSGPKLASRGQGLSGLMVAILPIYGDNKSANPAATTSFTEIRPSEFGINKGKVFYFKL